MEGNGEDYYQGCLPDWLRDLPITEDWFNFDGLDEEIWMANDYTLVEQRGQPVVQGAKESEEEEEEEVARMEACLSKIPPGYRFLPEDGELIKDYLMAKVNKKPLPMNRIRNVPFYRYCPDGLIEKYYGGDKGQRENEWYFFTKRERKHRKGTRASRLTPHGFWKATGSDKAITLNGKVIGFRKPLDFYHGIDQPSAKRTQWKMHEYRLNKCSPPPSPSSSNDIADPTHRMSWYCARCTSGVVRRTMIVEREEIRVATIIKRLRRLKWWAIIRMGYKTDLLQPAQTMLEPVLSIC